MLKAVENINNGELGQGVMVTPEGGYVVAQPDLYVLVAGFGQKLIISTVQGVVAKTSLANKQSPDCSGSARS